MYKPENNVCYYALIEDEEKIKKIKQRFPLKVIPTVDAKTYNDKGYSIFYLIQQSASSKRDKNSIEYIRLFALDLDNGTKEELRSLIDFSPLKPSLIVETKNGYHVYWYLKTPIKITNQNRNKIFKLFSTVMEQQLIPFFRLKDSFGEEVKRKDYKGLVKPVGADDNAKDVSRILRVPGFKHLKEINNPFMIKIVKENKLKYTIKEIQDAFPLVEKKANKVNLQAKNKKYSVFWDNFTNFDCRKGLELLSGLEVVNKDEFTFKENNNGTWQIYSNGKSTSCWLDHNGKIGSSDKGGPTLIQWLLYYGLSYSEIASIGKNILKVSSVPTVYRMANLLNKYKDITFTSTFFHYYLEELGIWIQWKPHNVTKEIIEILLQNGLDSLPTKVSSIEKTAAALFNYETDESTTSILNSNKDILVLKNCVLNTKTLEQLPFSKDFYSTIKLDYDYDKLGECQRWLQFLDEILPDKELQLLVQEMIGYCLTTETNHHKAFFLQGSGRNGKSTFLYVLRELIGGSNVSSVSYPEFADKFSLINLYNKLVNIDSELCDKLLGSTHIFKKIVGGDPLIVEQKNRPKFDTTLFCKLIFAANDLPAYTDRSKGFHSRLIIIPFMQDFSEEQNKNKVDKNLKYKLKTELSGILNWAIEGLIRLRAKGHFTKAKASQVKLEEYQFDNNSVLQFIKDECILDQDGLQSSISASEFFNIYFEYCKESNLKAFSKNKLGREIRKIKGIVASNTGGQGMCYLGIKLKNKAEF